MSIYSLEIIFVTVGKNL